VNEDANGRQAGFRADWGRDDERFTLQGDVYAGRIRQSPQRSFTGGNLLARWEGSTAQGEGWTVQASLDHTTRDHPGIFGETLDTLDLLAQYSRPWGDGHQLLVGAGYRRSNDDVTNSARLAFVPAKRSLEWSRVYAQGRFAWRTDLQATVAASLENNPYTGLELLPSVRLAWHVGESQLAWAAMSRAVRAPSRVDREYFVPAAPPYVIAGGPDFRSEVSTTLEAGWRAQQGRVASYALTVFRHEHDRQRSLAPTPNGLELRNDIEGSTQGLEAWARWRPRSNWRLDAGWVVLRKRLAARAGTEDRGGVAALGNDPSHWGSLRSSIDLSPRLSWDLQWRRVGARPQPTVPSYAALDSRLAWRAENGAELAFVVKNAADPRHVEWGVATNRADLEREFSLQLSWRH
jgi:iron complex outermembrane receptor protein